MPASKEGGYNYSKIMAEFARRDGIRIDKLLEAIELSLTGSPIEAAKIMGEIIKDDKLDYKIHALLAAHNVDEAMDIFSNEILPALKSGKQG